MTHAEHLTFLVVPAGSDESASVAFSTGVRSLLEMYGFVSIDVASPDVVVERLQRRRYSCILILNQQRWNWVEQALPKLVAGAGCVFLEGPVAETTAARIGLQTQPLSVQAGARARVATGRLRERLTYVLDGYAASDLLDLRPIRVQCTKICVDADGRNVKTSADVDSPLHEPPVIAQRLEGADEVLLALDDGGSPLLVRRGTVLVSSFPVFELLCRRLGVAVLEAPLGQASGERNGENLELALLHAIADVAEAGCAPLVSVEPWPELVGGVVTIRHDVDRPVSDADWARLLDWYRAEPSGVSWYYLAQTIDAARMAQTAAMGHEIALHYTNLDRRGDVEICAVRTAARLAGADLVGATVHGGNFHGMRDLRRLAAEGLAYGEILARCSFFPFRPLDLGEDGHVRRLPIWASARHLSVDKAMSPPTADFQYGERTKGAREKMQAHVVVMNHPDINFEALQSATRLYRGAHAESWTQAEVIAWWAATHDSDRVVLHGDFDREICTMKLRHEALRRPTLRVWAGVETRGAARRTDNFGAPHVLLPLGEDATATFRVR
jgi:hypothetical protein